MEHVEQSAIAKDFTELRIEPKPVYESVKRVQDLILATTALVLLAPVWLLIAVLVRLTTPGPAIYRQKNVVGRYGKLMTVYKFRTMYAHSSEKVHNKTIARFVKGEQIDMIEKDGKKIPVYKKTSDPRVTPIGRVLRKSGLDEIPQLVNVLKGEMSLVGPRAPLLFEYEHYTAAQKPRMEVIPGITGLYQVTARSMVTFDRMIEIDMDYIKRRSYWLDLQIMLVTPWVLITGKGAY
jgi:lipopolysaccharide/colanic/teichoic acid biosynthesis glycosyltransferase